MYSSHIVQLVLYGIGLYCTPMATGRVTIGGLELAKLKQCSFPKFFSRTGKTNAAGRDRLRFPSLFEIVLDPERAQIEKLEPTLFDIVLRPEEFISESSLEDESDYLEEIPAALIPLLSPQEPKEEQQPLDPNDYDQFRYYRISANSFHGNYSFLNLTLCTETFDHSTYRC